MRRSRHFCLLAGVIPLGIAISVHPLGAADVGYLRAAGPPPLRFAVPPLEVLDQAGITDTNAQVATTNPVTALPPSASTTTNKLAPVVVSVPVSTNLSRPTLSATSNATEVASAVPNQVVGVRPEQAGPAPSGIQAVMPQPHLFLQYFTPDYISGSNGYGVVFPVSFLPPQPSRGGSSSATYQTTPAEKP